MGWSRDDGKAAGWSRVPSAGAAPSYGPPEPEIYPPGTDPRCETYSAQADYRTAEPIPQPAAPSPTLGSAAHPALAHASGFAQVFGLHPAIALFVVLVNLMIGGMDATGGLISVVTGGLLAPEALGMATMISSIAGCVLAVITYMAQKKWNGDDAESARIKALIVGVLTAIPVALPGIVFGGIAMLQGLVRRRRD